MFEYYSRFWIPINNIVEIYYSTGRCGRGESYSFLLSRIGFVVALILRDVESVIQSASLASSSFVCVCVCGERREKLQNAKWLKWRELEPREKEREARE